MRDFARVLVSAAAVAGVVAAVNLLPATVVSPPAVIPLAAPAEEQADLVEDFTYPGAATILAQRGIKLIKGDGGILLADCAAGTGQASVESRTKGQICFNIRNSGGFLTLEIPEAYIIWSTPRRSIQATITVAGQNSSVTVPKNDFRGIGEGTGGPEPATVLELRAIPA